MRSHTAARRWALLPPWPPVGRRGRRRASRAARACRGRRCARPAWRSAAGRVRDGIATTATGRSSPAPRLEHGDDGVHDRRRDRAVVGRARSDQLAQPRAPADVGQPATARPSAICSSAAILPFTSTPRAAIPVGHWARASRSTPGRSMASRAVATACSDTVGRVPRPGAHVAPPARLGERVVEVTAQHLHPARRPGEVAAHRLLLVGRGPGRRGGSARGRTSTAAPVAIQPPCTRRTAPSTSSTLSIISSRPRRSGVRVSSAAVDSGRPAAASASSVELHEVLLRERERAEVAPDRLVLAARQQQHVGPLDGPAGPPDLLVVGDRRLRRADVDDEAEVGLVEAHAERRCRHERLDPVLDERRLGGQPLGGVGATGVGDDVVARRRAGTRRGPRRRRR